MELLFEFLAQGGIELIGDLFAYGELPRKRSQQRELSLNDRPSRRVFIAKMVAGAAVGAGWGYYVSRSTGGDWPRTFWTFLLIAVVTYVLHRVGASTERFTKDVRSRLVHVLFTFTPQRFLNWSTFAAACTVGTSVGFFLAG